MAVKNKDFLYLVSVIIAFGSFVFGYALVCISMMSDQLHKAHPITDSEFVFQLSLITTLLPLGAFLVLMQPLCDRFGENTAMLILDVFGTLAVVLQAYQLQFWSLYTGRFLLGIYVGIASGIIPTYLISISPPEVSGVVGSLNQLLITIGIAAAYGLGMMDLSWGTYMIIPALFCIVRFITLLFFKFDRLERHYTRGETAILQKYLDHFYENCSVEQLGNLRSFSNSGSSQQISEIKQDQSGFSGLINKMTSNSPSKVIKLSLILAVANQFSGINAIIFYAKQVFQHITQNNKEQALKYTFYLGVLQVIVTFFGGFLINRFGRRTLMLVGESIIVASLLCGFLFGQMQNSQNLITLVVFTHIIGFSISLGPVSMMYVAEMMQNITLVVCCVWTFTLFVSMVSEIMINAYGIGNVFLFYGIISSLCLMYLCTNMAESKGLTRKELIAKIQEDHEGSAHRDEKDEETGNSP